MIKAIVFDCFGVLYPQATGHFFKRHEELFGTDSTSLDKLNLQIDLGEIPRAEFFTRLEGIIGIPASEIQAEIDQELVFNQQLIDFIKKLKTRYKIGLLSNAGKEEIAIIYRDKIDVLFDAITVSYEASIVKPNPEIYSICAQRLGVELTECVFVDDNIASIEAAEKLGMRTVLYTNFDNFSKQLKGY